MAFHFLHISLFFFGEAFERIYGFFAQADHSQDHTGQTSRRLVFALDFKEWVKLGILDQILANHDLFQERFGTHDLDFGINHSRAGGETAKHVTKINNVGLISVDNHGRFCGVDWRLRERDVAHAQEDQHEAADNQPNPSFRRFNQRFDIDRICGV